MPAPPIEWSTIRTTLIIAVIIVAAVLVIAVAWHFIAKSLKARETAQVVRDALFQRLQEAQAKEETTFQKWMAYELDLELVMDYPAFANVSIKQVADFHTAQDKVRSKRTEILDEDLVSAYERAVTEHELAFKVAEDHVRRVGWNLLPASDVSKLEQMKLIINTAQNAGTPDAQQAGLYEQLEKLMNSVSHITFPARAKAEVHHRASVAITA